MVKTAFAALAAASAIAAPAAFAGPYVNVEANSSWTGSDYTGTNSDLHIGWEGELGAGSYYVQGGATIISPDNGEADTVPSGKAGLSVAMTEAIGFYGEVSFVGSGSDSVDRGYGSKAGLKYTF